MSSGSRFVNEVRPSILNDNISHVEGARRAGEIPVISQPSMSLSLSSVDSVSGDVIRGPIHFCALFQPQLLQPQSVASVPHGSRALDTAR